MAADDFFQNTTVDSLVQSTIRKVDELESREQRRLLRVFRQVRQDLQDRLLSIPEGTFTEQSLNITLVQINAAIETIKRDLKGQLISSSEILSERGIEDLIQEINKFSKVFEGAETPLNINAVLVATESRNFLLNKHEASMDAYSESLRSTITSNIVQAMATRETTQRTVSRMVKDVGQFFIGEEWKLNRIARTELHNIYNFSKLTGMKQTADQYIPDLKKALIHPIDSRTGDDSKQLASKNPIVDIDEPFVFTFTRRLKSGQVRKERREFMFPPDRPNDRSVLVPYRQEWGESASTM